MDNLFKLHHYYNIGNQDVFFVSNEPVEAIQRKAAFIQFRAETIVSEDITISTRELADILFTNIEVKEVEANEALNSISLDMNFIREELCPSANDLESEMKGEFDLIALDKLIKSTEDAIWR
ncbi:MAG: hypothetical protein ACPGSD_17710 [Flavobacteriales bacterium]